MKGVQRIDSRWIKEGIGRSSRWTSHQIKLSSDTGVDQGHLDGEIIVEKARRIKYQISDEVVDYFEIYANEREIEDEEDEEDLWENKFVI